jgi:hypothetical protein
MAAGTLAALTAITGCGAAGPDAAAAPDATLPVNGPYGAGGPFAAAAGRLASEVARPAAAATPAAATPAATSPAAASPAAASRVQAASPAGGAVRVDGSTAFNGNRRAPWLVALGYGVDVSAPPTVRPTTATPGDAEAGFYDAFYAGRLTEACDFVVPGQRAQCAATLAKSRAAAGSLRDAAVGFVVVKGDQSIVTMTGLSCGGQPAPAGCLGQHDPAWIFGYHVTFDALWTRIGKEGGNPLTATPFRQVAGHWYLDLNPAAAS